MGYCNGGGGGAVGVSSAFNCHETVGGPEVCTPIPTDCPASEVACGGAGSGTCYYALLEPCATGTSAGGASLAPTVSLPQAQQVKGWMDQHPKVKWYICGNNPRGVLREYLIGGAIKGAVIGGIAGGVAGAPEGGIGAFPGAVIGGAGGAITGASAGAMVAPFAIAACSAFGLYN